MAKRMQKTHTKLQPYQDTDQNSNIKKCKTSAEFPSKLNSIRIEQIGSFQMLGDQKKTTGSHIKTTHTPRRPKEPTSGPLTMIGCRQDTSERPNSNSYPNRNRLHAIQRLRATRETANTPTSDPSRMNG